MSHPRLTLALALASATCLSPVAVAGHDEPLDPERGRFATARVIEVVPVVRIVRISEPRRECWEEDRHPVHRHAGPPRTAGGAIAGALIGGAVGRQFGSGSGRDAATVAGALIGSAIGTDHARRDDWYRSRADAPHTRTRCDVREEWREEERVEGYRVTYEYDGVRYVTRTTRDPGAEMRVQVSVRPVGY